MTITSKKRFKTALVWFRRDLRTLDNQALTLACDRAENVIPLFVLDSAILSRADIAASRIDSLLDSLRDLNERLAAVGGRLVLLHGENPRTIVEAAVKWRVDCVFFHREYEPSGVKRDAEAARALTEAGIACEQTEGLMHVEPELLRTTAGKAYTVYTPYKRAWLNEAAHSPVPAPKRVSVPNEVKGLDIGTDLETFRRPNAQTIPSGGESAALGMLNEFAAKACWNYAVQRDLPAVAGTSRLSPHLHFGTISPRTVRQAVEDLRENSNAEQSRSIDVFISELCWRDFYLYILHHFPHVEKSAFKRELADIGWEDDDRLFDRWTAGTTGFPIVDAAMRQLSAEAWMHNRCRMIVASFLCKDLLIDWRRGERHFMRNLVDGDLASNNGGWQWTAGTGTDAQPYFRIFNPSSQGAKFDPNGDYVRRWIPDLARVPARCIHMPWLLSPAEKDYCGCKSYPDPVVDHSVQRIKALRLYKSVGEEAAA